MSAAGILPGIVPNWRLALGAAAAGHLALGGVLAIQRGEQAVALPDPVMVIELAAGAAPPPAPQPEDAPQPLAEELPQMVVPRIEAPRIDAPLPPDPVTLPTPQPVRLAARAQHVPQPVTPAPRLSAPRAQSQAPATATANSGTGPGSDPRAQQEQSDWYALVAAHLERNKRYPREARRDGLQGTPTVRFTVDRRGRVTDIAIRNSSGHPALDEATIALLRRVSPLPAMPRSMERDSVTISLPIEYSLSRK
ncbi:energy transducer TonB [Alteraurantiacibacter aquimixticola]|uniref:Energy transducer TonB n=1 Tax=Alteraurantiacibacter aquimixticola TaxID=2489173 RepID=A0A4T3F538_9SPHN|nr:energy transducer TonB [Alteraurantiacibacter aquimixticola]TIX51494.1 energy transducer TonB [Alteraurantiacibacter aquimixticola]